MCNSTESFNKFLFESYKNHAMNFDFNKLITVTFTLFAVVDIIGSIPLLVSLKEKIGGIKPLSATIVAGILMILFLFIGEQFLRILSLDVHSFAVGGSI